MSFPCQTIYEAIVWFMYLWLGKRKPLHSGDFQILFSLAFAFFPMLSYSFSLYLYPPCCWIPCCSSVLLLTKLSYLLIVNKLWHFRIFTRFSVSRSFRCFCFHFIYSVRVAVASCKSKGMTIKSCNSWKPTVPVRWKVCGGKYNSQLCYL